MTRRITVLCLLLISFAPVCGQTAVAEPVSAPALLTSHDVARIRAVIAAEISPDGKSVAVVTAVPRTSSEANGRSHLELSVVPFEGGPPRVLVPAPGTLSGVQWSGDSQAILFLSRRGQDKDVRVWSVPAGGGDPQALTPAGKSLKAFSASADGKRIAFAEEEADDPTRAARKKAGFNQEVYEEEWRMVRVRELDRASASVRTFDVPGSVFDIGYSANGTKLWATAAPTPSVDDSYMRKKVYVVDVATGAVVKAIDNPGKLGNVALSPDGASVAAVIGVDQHDTHESTLVVADAGKPGPYVVLTPPDYEGHVWQCGWLGGQLVALVHEGVEAGIAIVDPRSGRTTKVLAPGIGGAITKISMGPAERLGFVGSRPNHPPEAHAVDLKAANDGQAPKPVRLSNSNPWLEPGMPARQEVVTWKASADGREIQGMLIHPIAQPAKPAPLIVVVHGGPEAHDMNGWLTGYSAPGQVAAARGYYVLHPNYRSSTGRGVAFAKLGQGDLANGEFTDIVDGIDALVAKGLVDKTRVGMMGGSYGGYLSAWAATKWTDRFAAAVVFVGISDQVSKRLCTDIPMEDYLVHWRIWTDENTALVWDRSPIAHAKGAKTPTLICHGKDDPRVNPAQSLELYRTLKTRGAAPVRLVWYPGEGHGNQARCSRLDYSIRSLAWFDHFLMKNGKDLPPGEIDYGEGAGKPAGPK